MCKLFSVSDKDFIKIVNDSYYIKDILNKCGYSSSLNKRTRDKVKKRIIDLGINIEHFKYKKPKKIEELCIKGGKYHRGGLKRRLINSKLLNNVCDICGIDSIWNKKKLVLQLDHINGNNCDNRLENLRLLCPNCHSQTKTYGGRNKGSVSSVG